MLNMNFENGYGQLMPSVEMFDFHVLFNPGLYHT